MKRYLYIVLTALVCSTLFNSCLKDGLDDVEYAKDCDIKSVAFEYRWAVPTGNVEGIYTLYFKTMTVNSTIDAEGSKVTVDITVPTTDKSYTQAERDKTSLSSIACSFVVSNAAKVSPLNGAPVLGTLGDYSGKTFTYRVTSASGVYKDWQIVINNFTK
jgi:hypothetical protein